MHLLICLLMLHAGFRHAHVLACPISHAQPHAGASTCSCACAPFHTSFSEFAAAQSLPTTVWAPLIASERASTSRAAPHMGAGKQPHINSEYLGGRNFQQKCMSVPLRPP
jgi:hypothetical protein